MKPYTVYKLVQELKRRRVFRGIIVYGASTLILLEAAQNISSVFGLEAAPRWFVWLLGLGFFGSLWFSWIYDITPGGIKKTESSKEQPVPIPKKEVRLYQTTTFLSVVIIIGLLAYNIIDGANKKKIQSLEKSIAVLPLFDEELSPNEARDFEFIGHEITSCLLKIKDYRVVPWEDARNYSREGKTYTIIGNDLSAAILVDWKPHVSYLDKRLSVDLVSANDESLLWSENFKIEGTWPTEICKHSRKISKKITRKLRTYLTPQERAFINEQPVSAQASMFASLGTAMTQDSWELAQTGNNGNEKNEYTDSISFDRAIKYFTEAIHEEPAFAKAYAQRAKAMLLGVSAGFYDLSVLPACEKDMRKASELHPNLPEAEVAMGFYYYYGRKEYMLALTSFEKAVELRPNNNEYLFYLSIIWRSIGNWEQVKTLTDKVFVSNPRNVLYLTNLGLSYLYLQEFSRSIICQNRAIELMPQWYAPYINKIEALTATNNLREARRVIKTAREQTDNEYYRTTAQIDLYEGKFTSAIKNIERAKVTEFKDLSETRGDAYLLKAKIYKHAGKEKRAEEYYNKALDFFNNLILFNPEDYTGYSRRGIAYAGIGMNQKAIENAQIALEYTNQYENRKNTLYILHDLIQLYAIMGDHETARDLMTELLKKKSFFTSESLKLDPDIRQLPDEL